MHFVKIPGATWQQRLNLLQGVACIRLLVQHWKLETHGTATVARKGFSTACDFGHLCMGATLPAFGFKDKCQYWQYNHRRQINYPIECFLGYLEQAESLAAF